MPDALYIPGAPKREPLGRGGEAARRRSAGRGLPSRLSHSGVWTSHQPPAAVPWHSLSSPESRRQRDRTRDGCSAATEYRGTRRDSRPLRLWQWHRRTESGQNPAPVRVRPRWSSGIPTRIAHGFGHDHARVFMEAIGDRAVVRFASPWVVRSLGGRRPGVHPAGPAPRPDAVACTGLSAAVHS